jgi:hypothetical protein
MIGIKLILKMNNFYIEREPHLKYQISKEDLWTYITCIELSKKREVSRFAPEIENGRASPHAWDMEVILSSVLFIFSFF